MPNCQPATFLLSSVVVVRLREPVGLGAYTVKYAVDRGTQVYNLKEYISGGTENGIF